MKPGRTGLSRIVHATNYSIKGIKSAWESEAAFRQLSSVAMTLTVISCFLPVSKVEQLLMIGSLVLVLIAELLNSAIEAVVDRIGSEFHELSGKAKDISSAAVFFAIGFAVLTWIILLI